MKKVLICLALLSMVLGFTAFECTSAEVTGAKLYIQQKQYEKAKEVLLKEVEKNPASDEGWYLLGLSIYGEYENNIPKMLEAFDKSLAVSKKFEPTITDYKKYAWQTNFNKGVSYFNQAVKIGKPDSMNIFFEKAIQMFNNSILCQPDSTIGYENVAAAYLNMGKAKDATPMFEKLTKIGKPAYAFARLGQIYLVDGAEFIDKFKVSKNPADSAKGFEFYGKALSVLENGRNRFPTDSDILLQLGNAYYMSNKIDVAMASYKILVEKSPANKELRYAYGVVLLKAQKYADAAANLEEVLKLDENYTDAMYNLAATYINWGNTMREESVKKENQDKTYQEKFKLAVPLLEKYLSIKPNEGRVWISLGQVYANLGMEEKSKEAFKKADENK